VCAAPAAVLSEPGAGMAPAPQQWRILVVDDNADSAEAMAMVLEANGHQLHTATSGERAIEIARQVQPHLVLLDIGLPGISGYEVARVLRDSAHSRHATLVALTGYGTSYDRERAVQAGFDHHLVKPADFARLYAIIDALPAPPQAA